MVMGRKCQGLLLVPFIVLASREVVMPSEARVCESKSHGFHGPCASSHNCALACHSEGFTGGNAVDSVAAAFAHEIVEAYRVID